MFRKLFSLILLLPLLGKAQDIDVQHYSFSIRLFDSTDRIEGDAMLSIRFPGGNRSFAIDLVGKKASGKGMTVQRLSGPQVASWKQEGDRILVELTPGINPRDTYQFQVSYQGIPADGLIISKNKWGDRTFFADNWPNRAHHWIPCNDRPDDKASFDFRVTAPPGYGVISNGGFAPVEEAGPIQPPSRRSAQRDVHWVEPIPLSTKVMVIGVAKFASKTFADSPPDLPVSAWVYPQDSTNGFYDYAVTPAILKFFSEYIAPFPYNKLANVQSKTIFGGMENASAIFYAEESVTGDRKWEDVFAHEIAHQWFGDMASEKSFAHLWLSEGFATYMTNMYIESKYGVDSMRRRLETDRKKIIEFVTANPDHPVVDSTKDLMSLLNANSYDKGGWVLHMLRQQVGDKVFQKMIQAYYNSYKGGNAETRDFERIVDSVYHADNTFRKLPEFSVDTFFNQWLFRPGIPELEFKPVTGGRGAFTLRQRGTLYSFPLEVGILDETSEEMMILKFWIHDRETELDLGTPKPGRRILLDPNTKLLFRSEPGGGNYYRTKRQLRD